MMESRGVLDLPPLFQDTIPKPRYSKNTVYIIGDAKTAVNNAITVQYGGYFIALVIDVDQEEIVDAGVSATIAVTNEFARSIFIGYSMKQGIEPMVEEITRRYQGASQAAMIVAWKDAYKRYSQVLRKWKK